jgi:hypothetical protein
MMMKKRTTLLSVALCFLCLGWTTLARAEEKPIQLSLFTPIQIFPESDTIAGFRFNLLYGRNVSMTGLDLGLVNHITRGSFTGLQWSLVGITEGEFKGLQLGVINYAKQVRGVQFGFVNYAGTIYGLQIGLINIIGQGGWLPVCIIVNGSF